MWNKHEGFLLLESLLAMVVLSIGIIFLFETLVFLHAQEKSTKDELEMAIFAKEWSLAKEEIDQVAIIEKAVKNQIIIKESSERNIVVEKNGKILDISKLN